MFRSRASRGFVGLPPPSPAKMAPSKGTARHGAGADHMGTQSTAGGWMCPNVTLQVCSGGARDTVSEMSAFEAGE